MATESNTETSGSATKGRTGLHKVGRQTNEKKSRSVVVEPPKDSKREVLAYTNLCKKKCFTKSKM